MNSFLYHGRQGGELSRNRWCVIQILAGRHACPSLLGFLSVHLRKIFVPFREKGNIVGFWKVSSKNVKMPRKCHWSSTTSNSRGNGCVKSHTHSLLTPDHFTPPPKLVLLFGQSFPWPSWWSVATHQKQPSLLLGPLLQSSQARHGTWPSRLKDCGNGSFKKHLPSWMIVLSKHANKCTYKGT